MKYLLSLFILATSVQLLATQEIFLDDVMSKEEQTKTGIAKLNPQQKIALEQWLNKHFVLKSSADQNANGDLSLSINIDNGQKLQLSDNSIWEIAPSDIQKASVWIMPFPIKISPSNDPAYPYSITNLRTGESVKARKWAPQNSLTPAPNQNPAIPLK